mmetsp:Transcript_19607/g.35641  ORF Transcript_19607/g.35641 Transcript_19607/m.35641 type:complete len:341 (+) Transcript_19607:2-1024(+)
MFQLSPLSKGPGGLGSPGPSPVAMADGDQGAELNKQQLESAGSSAGKLLSSGSQHSSSSSCPSCPEVAPMDLEYFEHIGAGHTSEVFRGLFKGKEVAIKQLNMPAHKVKDEALAREVAIMCLVRHPNIVSLLGVVMCSHPVRIIMECCNGGSCFDFLHRQNAVKPTLAQALRMALQGAVAMDYLHKFTPRIIHRDLKSLNMLLVEDIRSSKDVPQLKVADFGLARALDSAEPLTLGVGTNNWMAPEMFCRRTYDEKVDVYSYGMVLYEIICRRIPYKGEDPASLRRLVITGKRPDISYVPSQCPKIICDLIVECWAPDSSARPAFEEVVKRVQKAGVISL